MKTNEDIENDDFPVSVQKKIHKKIVDEFLEEETEEEQDEDDLEDYDLGKKLDEEVGEDEEDS